MSWPSLKRSESKISRLTRFALEGSGAGSSPLRLLGRGRRSQPRGQPSPHGSRSFVATACAEYIMPRPPCRPMEGGPRGDAPLVGSEGPRGDGARRQCPPASAGVAGRQPPHSPARPGATRPTRGAPEGENERGDRWERKYKTTEKKREAAPRAAAGATVEPPPRTTRADHPRGCDVPPPVPPQPFPPTLTQGAATVATPARPASPGTPPLP